MKDDIIFYPQLLLDQSDSESEEEEEEANADTV